MSNDERIAKRRTVGVQTYDEDRRESNSVYEVQLISYIGEPRAQLQIRHERHRDLSAHACLTREQAEVLAMALLAFVRDAPNGGQR